MTTEWKDITDPEELFKLKREGWEIELCHRGEWYPWDGAHWDQSHIFHARPRQPKTQVVKSRCWRNSNGQLSWWDDSVEPIDPWVRFPAGDIEGEVEV